MPLIPVVIVLVGLYCWLGPLRRVRIVQWLGLVSALLAGLGALMELARWIPYCCGS